MKAAWSSLPYKLFSLSKLHVFQSVGHGMALAHFSVMPGRNLPLRLGFCAIWLLLVGAGFAVILNYQNTAGAAGRIPRQWPAKAAVALASGQDTLLMFAHPRCPCTRASMEELNRLMAHANGKIAVHVFFFKPNTYSNDWAQSDTWWSAAAIPGVTVQEDVDGKEARLFGAETSGYVLLYDRTGKLLFHGGITGSRGHAGDNPGEEALLALSAGRDAATKQTPVFGCSLLGECEKPISETNQ
jgi:hypothetical protein